VISSTSAISRGAWSVERRSVLYPLITSRTLLRSWATSSTSRTAASKRAVSSCCGELGRPGVMRSPRPAASPRRRSAAQGRRVPLSSAARSVAAHYRQRNASSSTRGLDRRRRRDRVRLAARVARGHGIPRRGRGVDPRGCADAARAAPDRRAARGLPAAGRERSRARARAADGRTD